MDGQVIIVHIVRNRSFMKIAITGTIAAGKTTVAILFRRRGIPVFNADQYAKRSLYQGSVCYEKILEVFGDDVTSTSGDIDSKKLAGIIFYDNRKREQLNAIVHPFVLEGMQKFFTTNLQQPIICAEVPLLFETGWDQYFDRTVVVTCSEKIAIQRMMEERNYTLEEAKARLSMQVPAEKQIAMADKVIYNEGDLKELDSQINRWLGELRKDIRNGKNAN